MAIVQRPMRTGYFILLAVIAFSTSCNSKQSYSELLEPIETDTTYTDFEKDGFWHLADKMKIPDLRKGAKGFEWRLWAPMEWTYDHNNMVLVSAKYQEGKWNFSATKIYMNLPSYHKDSIHPFFRIRIDSIATSQVNLKGREKFLKALLGMNLHKSPTQADLERDLVYDTGHVSFTIEVANESSYKIITYTCATRKAGFTEFDTKLIDLIKQAREKFEVQFEICERG